MPMSRLAVALGLALAASIAAASLSCAYLLASAAWAAPRAIARTTMHSTHALDTIRSHLPKVSNATAESKGFVEGR